MFYRLDFTLGNSNYTKDNDGIFYFFQKYKIVWPVCVFKRDSIYLGIVDSFG